MENNAPSKEWKLSLRGGSLSLKFLPYWFSVGHNNLYPSLKTYDDFLKIRVVFRKKEFFYHELEGVDFSAGFFQGNALSFIPREGFFRYTVALQEKDDVKEVLLFLEKKGVPLMEKARRFLRE